MTTDSSNDLRNRTKQFALRIVRLYTALPNSAVAQTMGKQLLRSGISVGAHYREASRARSDAEFISKLEVALQELDESSYWLELLVAAEIVPAQKLADLQDETYQLLAILVTCVKNAKSR